MTRRYGKYWAKVPISDRVGIAPSDYLIQIVEVTGSGSSFMVELSKDDAVHTAKYIIDRYVNDSSSDQEAA